MHRVEIVQCEGLACIERVCHSRPHVSVCGIIDWSIRWHTIAAANILCQEGSTSALVVALRQVLGRPLSVA